MSIHEDCMHAGFTDSQCRFLLRPSRLPTPPTVTESIDDYLQKPRSLEFVRDLAEANTTDSTGTLQTSINLGRLQCMPVGLDMYMCTM